MTNEKMTVHKALVELKTIDARIEKTIRDASFVIANKHSNQKISGESSGLFDLYEFMEYIHDVSMRKGFGSDRFLGNIG